MALLLVLFAVDTLQERRLLGACASADRGVHVFLASRDAEVLTFQRHASSRCATCVSGGPSHPGGPCCLLRAAAERRQQGATLGLVVDERSRQALLALAGQQ
jgi:hypothetical protein